MNRIRPSDLRAWLADHTGGGGPGITAAAESSGPAPEMRAQDRQVRTVGGYHVDTDALDPIYTRTLKSNGSGPLFKTVYRTDEPDTFVLYRRHHRRIERTVGKAFKRLVEDDGYSGTLGGFLFCSGLGVIGTGVLFALASLSGGPSLLLAFWCALTGGTAAGAGIGVEYTATPREEGPVVDCQELAVIHGEERLRSRVNERGDEQSLPRRFRPKDLSVDGSSP